MTNQIGVGKIIAAVFLAIILGAIVIGGFLSVMSVARESAGARDKMRTLLFDGARDHEVDRFKHGDFGSTHEEQSWNVLHDRLRQIEEAEESGKPDPPNLPEYSP